MQVKHWNKSGQEVRKSHLRRNRINDFLARYRTEIESEVRYWEQKSPQLRASDSKQRMLRYNKTVGSSFVTKINFFEFAQYLFNGLKKLENTEKRKTIG